MNYMNIVLVYGAISSVAVPAGFGLDYWARHEFITVGGQLKSDIRDVKAQIRSLEYDKQNGTATAKDLWLLDQLYGDLEDLQDEQNN